MEKISCKGKAAGGGIIIETHADGGQVKTDHLRGVRCGLSWPAAASPGYYCLVGQYSKSNPIGKYPLLLLREGQDQLVNSLLRKMFDDLGVFCGEEIYSDLSENFRSYMIAFGLYQRNERGSQHLTLKFAPFYQSFVHGVSLIREWKNEDALIIPKDTIVHKQLREMQVDDLKSNPEESFCAVNGLRFVVGAFEASLVCPPERGEVSPPLSPEAWT